MPPDVSIVNGKDDDDDERKLQWNKQKSARNNNFLSSWVKIFKFPDKRREENTFWTDAW
jgi:hypothetical protein